MGVKTVLLWLLPGLCQIQHGQAGRGLGWFCLFVLAANLALIAPYVTAVKAVRPVALVVAGAIWLLAAWDGARCANREKKERREQETPAASVK